MRSLQLTNEQKELMREFITPDITNMEDFPDDVYEKMKNILHMYTPYKSKTGDALRKAREANIAIKERNEAMGLPCIDPLLPINKFINELNERN